MVTIGRLNYQITADTSKFSKGVVATRKELSAARRIMRETRTPTERYGDEVAKLDSLLKKGAITQETYNRKLGQLRGELRQARRATGAQIPVVGQLTSRFAGMSPAAIGATAAIAGITAGLVAAAAATRALSRQLAEQFEQIDKLAKTSRKLGVTIDELRGLRAAAAELAGVDTEAFDTSLQRMTRRIAEAAQGSGAARDTIEQLGLSAQQLSTAGPAEAFKQLAEALQGVDSQSQRVKIAFDLFGREGVDLANALSAGRKEIEAIQDETIRLSGSLDEVDAAQVEALNDEWERTKRALGGVFTELAVDLAPLLRVVADDLTALFSGEVSPATRDTLETLELILRGIGATIGFVIRAFEGAQLTVQNTANALVELVAWLDRMKALLPGFEETEGLQQFADALQDTVDQANRDFDQGGSSIDQFKKRIADARREIEENAKQNEETAKTLGNLGSSGATAAAAMHGLGMALAMGQQMAALQKATKEAEQALERLKTPQEKARDAVADYKRWLDLGAISQDEFNQLLEEQIVKQERLAANNAVLKGSAAAQQLEQQLRAGDQAAQRREAAIAALRSESTISSPEAESERRESKQTVSLLTRIEEHTAREPIEVREF